MIGDPMASDLQWFGSRVTDVSRRVIDLEQRARCVPARDGLLMLDLVEELRTAMEELQVANEELRTQSEELQSVRGIVEQERLQYLDLFMAAPDPYLVTDVYGVIRLANPEAAELLGLPCATLRGRPLALHVAPAQRQTFRTELNTFRTATKVQSLMLRLRKWDAAEHEVSARIRAVPRSNTDTELCWTLRETGTERAEAQRLRALAAELGETGPRPLDDTASLVRAIGSWWNEMTGASVLIPDLQGRLRMIASTDPQKRILEVLHARAEQGPASDAYRDAQVVDAPDLASDARYPYFGPAAAAAGITSMTAYPLHLHTNLARRSLSQPVGVLIMTDKHPNRVSEHLLRGAGLVAEVARTLLRNAQDLKEAKALAAQLQTALGTRIMIEQAKGKLAERLHCTPDEAFPLIRSYARSHNLRLHDVATQIVENKIDPLHPSNRAAT